MTMSEHHVHLNFRMKRICFFALFLIPFLVSCFCIPAACEGNIQISLQENEWTWEENSTAVFSGTIQSASLPEKVLMKLSVAAVPEKEDAGEAVFQNVNGKKLTIRKQKPEYTFSADGISEFGFTGIWNTPESVLFTRVDILLQIWNADGSELLAEQTLSVSREASDVVEKDDGRIRLKENFSDWTLYIAIAAAAVWILAVIRVLINRKKIKKQR